MTISDPLGWAESAAPGDVTEPPGGVRLAGYQFEDELPHDEFNAIIRGLYRWVAYHETNTFAPRTHAAFAASGAAFGYVWEGDYPFGEVFPNVTSNQLAIYKMHKDGDKLYSIEINTTTSNTQLYVYDVDGDVISSRTSVMQIIGLPADFGTCFVTTTRDHVIFAVDDKLAIKAKGGTTVLVDLLRTDGKDFAGAYPIGEDSFVAIAGDSVEKYSIPALPPTADEGDADSSWAFEATKTAFSVCAVGPYIFVGGVPRTDTSHVAIYRLDSGGTEIGKRTVLAAGVDVVTDIVTDGKYLYVLSLDTGNASYIEKYQIVHGNTASGDDVLTDATLSLIDTTGIGTVCLGLSIDGESLYTHQVGGATVFVIDKHTMEWSSVAVHGQTTDALCVVGCDTKFVIGRENGATSPSLVAVATGRPPQLYQKSQAVEPRTMYQPSFPVSR